MRGQALTNNPILIIFAGPNGAGKTTYAEEFCKRFDLDFINPDMIIADSELVKGKLFLQILHKRIDTGNSFSFETTMSGKWLASFLQKAKEVGYRMVCFYIFVYPAEILKYRIEERVKKGGHFVDFETVKRRYKKSFKNFWFMYRKFFDEWEIINNTESFKPVAKGMKTSFEVEDEFIFNSFIKFLKE